MFGDTAGEGTGLGAAAAETTAGIHLEQDPGSSGVVSHSKRGWASRFLLCALGMAPVLSLQI